MKISKLLILGAAWLGIASSAKAEVPDGVWSMPDPSASLEFTTFSADIDPETYEPIQYYLYNPGAKMFFASGNSWNTQASVRTFGYPFWVQDATEEDAPEGSYELWNYVNNPDRTDVTGNHNLFTDDGGSTWVDHGSQGNYSWTFTLVGEFVRFQNVALIADVPDYDGKYIGWTGDYAGAGYSSVLSMVAPDDEGVCVDWKAVTKASYEAFTASDAYKAYTDGVACFFLAKDLRALLIEAEEIGAQVADQLAVYLNTSSTPDELTAAIAAAKEAIEKRKQEIIDSQYDNATVANPVDVTDKFIKNAHFDNGDCTTGWSGDAFGRGGTVADGAEHYSKNYDTYQTVTGLKPGVYAIGVNAFYRAGNYGGDAERHFVANDAASKYAKLYGKVGELYLETPIANVLSGGQSEPQNQGDIEVTYQDAEGNDVVLYVPNTMKTGDYYFHTLNQYANKLIVAVGEDGELTIGVKKTSQIGGDWSLFDDFSLTYYGKGADAAQVYLEEALKNYSEYTPEEGTLFTQAYLTAYNELVNAEHSANSLEEVNATLNAINVAYEALQSNIKLWKKFQELIKKGTEMAGNSEYEDIEETGDLMDYIEGDAADALEELAWTNEELEAAIAQMEEWIQTIIDKSKLDVWEGKDMTQYITNPGFDDDEDMDYGGAMGWTVDRVGDGNVVRGPLGQDNYDLMVSALGKMNYCFESWHCHKWDIWQEVKDLPTGMYEVQVQGYVRCEVGGYTRGDDIEPNYPSPVQLYMNSATSQFPSVYSERRPINPETGEEYTYTTVESWTVENINDYDYPNSMGGAAQAFGWGMYQKSAFGLIAKDGDTFRIGVRMDKNEDWWCIWDTFKLIYHEPTAELVQPLLEEELAKIDLTKPMGSDVFAQAAEVKKMAEEAIASGDGKTMFEALSKVYELSDAINASVAIFQELNDACESLQEVMGTYYDSEFIGAATQLVGTIMDGMENHTYKNEDVESLLAQIAEMKTKLRLPAGYKNASDSNPVSLTAVIENPNYEENLNGWSGTSAGYNADATNAEIFGANFDYYQEIVGLPAGTYQVSVQGFYRAGTTAVDYETRDDASVSHAFLYAVNGDSVVFSSPLTRLAAEPNVAGSSEDTDLPDGCAWASKENMLYVANTMVTAGDEFGLGKYANNVVLFTVGIDGKARIGLKKNVNISDNWTIWDNWQLVYFGAASGQQPNGDPSGIETIAAGDRLTVEYFTLDGRKANANQRGILIQKTTLSNGAVLVNKIRR